jgi:hypothetical protein
MLFGVGSNQREEACLDYSNVVPLHSELVLLLRDSMTGAVRYKVERHRDDVSEQYVRQRMARFRDEGQELMHAFVGAECQVMKYFT